MIKNRIVVLAACLALAVTGYACSQFSGGGEEIPSAAAPSRTAKRFADNSVVKEKACLACHEVGGEGGSVGPSLDQVANRRSEDWLRRWLSDPNSIKNGTKMPNFQFSARELETLMADLGALKRSPRATSIMAGSESMEKKGEALFGDFDCYACHRVGDQGRFIGPNLTWVGNRRPEAWEDHWLSDPGAVKPETFMPNFHLPDEQRAALVAFLHGLQGGRNAEARRWEDNTAFFLDSRPREIGSMVYRRFGCDGCHGQDATGGYANPNAAPNEQMPAIVAYARDNSKSAFKEGVFSGRTPNSLIPSAPDPLSCPAWRDTMVETEADYIYEYLLSITPKKKKFRFKRSG